MKSMRARSFATVLAAALAFTLFPSGAASADVTLPSATSVRLAGADRYSTAVEVSRQYSAGVPVLFVATGADFPDALSAAAAAASFGGPLLLTPKASLPANVLTEAKRLRPAKIVVVGGAGAVSDAVKNRLGSVAPTQRWGAADRYSTGLKIVDSAFAAGSSTTALIATGRTFPDALAATGAAGARKAPVILVDGAKSTVTPQTLQSLRRIGVTTVTIAGGTGAVSAGIENQLKRSFSVTRIGGADRYSTAAKLNDAFFPAGSTTTGFLATGANFPDALAGAALAGLVGAPLYVTTPACVPEPVRASLVSRGVTARVTLGGAAVVSDAAAKGLGCLTAGKPSITGSASSGSTLTAKPGSWSTGTVFSYAWLANGKAISGATGSTLALTDGLVGKRISVVVTGRKSGYVTLVRTSAQTAPIARPNRTPPVNGTCPSWAPIKGNASSMIYHMPGGRWYDETNPEECFATEAAARAAGYRAAKG